MASEREMVAALSRLERETTDLAWRVARLEEVHVAALALVRQIDVVHRDEGYQAVWCLAMLHGHRYSGPTYADQLRRLRLALGQAAPPGE